jgi:hypothetical protein
MKRNALRPVTLFGTVVTMLAVTILLTRSHATFSMSGVGSLKCYIPAGIQKRVEFGCKQADVRDSDMQKLPPIALSLMRHEPG